MKNLDSLNLILSINPVISSPSAKNIRDDGNNTSRETRSKNINKKKTFKDELDKKNKKYSNNNLDIRV